MAKHFDGLGRYVDIKKRRAAPSDPSPTNPDPDGLDSINLTGDTENEKPKIVRLMSSKTDIEAKAKEKTEEATTKKKRTRRINEKIQGTDVAPIEGAE